MNILSEDYARGFTDGYMDGMYQLTAQQIVEKVTDTIGAKTLSEQTIRALLMTTEQTYRSVQNQHCFDNGFTYYLELAKTLYRTGRTGGSFSHFAGVSAIRLKEYLTRLQITGIEPNDISYELMKIATWFYAYPHVSMEHQGKMGALLRACGEYFEISQIKDFMAKCTRLDNIDDLENLQTAKDLIYVGWITEHGAEQVTEGYLRSETDLPQIQAMVEHLQNEIRHECRYTDAHDTDMDVVKKDLRTLSKCPGWDTSKVETWFENEFPYKVTKPV